MLTFNNKEKVEKIYGIKTILNIIVKIEPLRKNTKLIPQCRDVKVLNHTQAYCMKEPRCVKCAENYLTSDFKSSKAKCINYKGTHSANYWGMKQQKRRNMTLMNQDHRPRQLSLANSNNEMQVKAKNEKLKKTKPEIKNIF